MPNIQTSNGVIRYQEQVLYPGIKPMDKEITLENLRDMSLYLDKSGIKWGPAFSTLIGIVREDDFLSWEQNLNLYVLKEDEERFKDLIPMMHEVGFDLVRYYRRGLYSIMRNGEYIDIYVMRKISSDIRHSGGVDFIHEKFLQNTTAWDFKGLQLQVPSELDEYLTFQYGDWLRPQNTRSYDLNWFQRTMRKWRFRFTNSLPDKLYYPLILRHHKRDFEKFKALCAKNGCPLPDNVELSYSVPRKYKKVLTVGVYDLLHKGHVELYRRARGLGDYLIVAAQDSDFILKYKPTAKVLNSTEDRKYMIKSIRYVDEVITYTDVDKIVQEVDFDIFVTGPDQCHAGFQRAIQWCEEHGKEHTVLARTDGVSSSELKAKIANKQKNNGNN